MSATYASSTGSLLGGIRVQFLHEDWAEVRDALAREAERDEALRRVAAREAYARGLFEHSPVSLWVEDFSAIRQRFDALRAEGVRDLRAHIEAHPDFVRASMAAIRILEVNKQTLATFGAPDLPSLLARLDDILGDHVRASFVEELVDLWDGHLVQTREVVNRALDGTRMHFVMHFAVLPGCEEDWSLVQVALTDITARKKAEAYLEYVGTHDTLTKLSNRTFFLNRMRELEAAKADPVSVMMIDLNGLKEINDTHGHAAGDDILRRAGEVIVEAVPKSAVAARIGGDEFAVLMPGFNENDAKSRADALLKLCEISNQFHPEERLSLSIGLALRRPQERLEETLRRADAHMYVAKRGHYAALGAERRRRCPPAAA